MYELRALSNDGIIHCGCHASIEKCMNTAEYVFKWLKENQNTSHITFIIKDRHGRVCAICVY